MEPADPRFLSARDAARALGISRATLYAYSSRGQLRSESVSGEPREHRYYREDVERLVERKEARRDPSKAVAKSLHMGAPVLESALTLVHDGRLYYRGEDVTVLAREATVEQVAALLWTGNAGEASVLFPQPCPLEAPQVWALRRMASGIPLCQMALPLAALVDVRAYDLRPGAVAESGARILWLLAHLIAGSDRPGPVAKAVRNAWAAGDKAAGEAIRAALILCADHELNVSAFAARCTASAAASPYDVVSSALATLKGRRHGGQGEQVEALFAEAASLGCARTAIANRLRRGETVPGLGHSLYPGGDPRAKLLLEMAQSSGNRKQWELVNGVANAAAELRQDLPNVDFGLAALTRAYRLPEGAPLLLFALGRTIGWIGHAMEQYATGTLIRPRARYTGPAPTDSAV